MPKQLKESPTYGARMLSWKKPVLFLISFFVVWATRDFIYGHVDIEPMILATISSFFLKTIVWVVLPILYVALIDKRKPLEYLKLRANARKTTIWSLVVIAIGVVWQLALLALELDDKAPNLREIYVSIWSAGVCEEVLFRGFFLNKFGEFMSFTKAALITSLLFVLVHVPGWLVKDYAFTKMISAGLYVLLISLIFSVLVKKSNSLYPSIIFHSIADLIAI